MRKIIDSPTLKEALEEFLKDGYDVEEIEVKQLYIREDGVIMVALQYQEDGELFYSVEPIGDVWKEME